MLNRPCKKVNQTYWFKMDLMVIGKQNKEPKQAFTSVESHCHSIWSQKVVIGQESTVLKGSFANPMTGLPNKLW